MDKVDHLAKKPKVVITTTAGETPPATKLPPLPHHGTKKGLMTAKGPVVEKRPPLLRKTRDMPSGNSRPSSRMIIMKTWATMQLKPWGRLAFSAWHRCVTILFPFRFSITLISNLILTLAGGADDEGLDGLLHGLRKVGCPFKGEG